MSTTHRTDTGPSSGQTALLSLWISLLGPAWAFDESGLSVSPHTALHCTSGGCGRATCSLCLQGRSQARRMWLSSWTLPMLVLATEAVVVFFFFFFFFAKAVPSQCQRKATIYAHVCGRLFVSFVGSSVFLCLLKNKTPSALSKIPGFVTLFAFAIESPLALAGLLTYCVAMDDLEFLILQLPISEVLGFQKHHTWFSFSFFPFGAGGRS